MEQSNIKITKLIAKLKIAYPHYFRDLKPEELIELYGLYQEELNIYDEDTLNKSIKQLIRTKQYMPSLNEIIEECENNKHTYKSKIVELMIQDNYFANDYEIEKICKWLEKGIIPNWFKEDMKKYETKLISNNKVELLGMI